MKARKVYYIYLEFGTHRGVVNTNKYDFTEWIKELSKEFKIQTRTSGKTKILFIYNYWGNMQDIGGIYTY